MSLCANSSPVLEAHGVPWTCVETRRRKRTLEDMRNENWDGVGWGMEEKDMSPPTKKYNLLSASKNEPKATSLTFAGFSEEESEKRKAKKPSLVESSHLFIGRKRKHAFTDLNDKTTSWLGSDPSALHVKCPKLSHDQISPYEFERKTGNIKLPAKPQLLCDDEKKNDDSAYFVSSTTKEGSLSSSLPSSCSSSPSPQAWEQSDLLRQLNGEDGSRKRLVIPKDTYKKRSLLRLLLGASEPLNSKSGALVKYQDPRTTIFGVDRVLDKDYRGVDDSNCKNNSTSDAFKRYRFNNPINPFEGKNLLFQPANGSKCRKHCANIAKENGDDIEMEDHKLNQTLCNADLAHFEPMSQPLPYGNGLVLSQAKAPLCPIPEPISSRSNLMDID